MRSAFASETSYELRGFLVWLRQTVLVACTTCAAYVTRGEVHWDAQGACWALHCGYCGTPAVRSTPYMLPTPKERTIDA